MKKILAILLLLAMTMSLFTACSKESSKPSKRKHRRETETTEEVTEAPTEKETITEVPTTEAETVTETEAETEEETKAETTEKVTEAHTEASETEENAIKEDEYPLDRENPVTDLYDEDKGQHSFHIPQLNCKTKDGDKINKEIDEVFCEEARQGLEQEERGSRPIYYEIDYSSHWYGDVFVLIIWKITDNDFHEYRVYNVYRNTGNLMSNDGILRMMKVPREEFLAGAAKAAEDFYRNYYPEELLGGDDLYQEQLDWTLAPENINMDMMMFPGENGKLMLLSKIGSLIGSCYYEQIYEYEKP